MARDLSWAIVSRQPHGMPVSHAQRKNEFWSLTLRHAGLTDALVVNMLDYFFDFVAQFLEQDLCYSK